MYQAYYESEVGLLEITANQEGITSVIFVDERQEENKNEMIEQCINELDEYFKGKRKEKSLRSRCLRREQHFKKMYGMHFILFHTA
ncbi:O6-methylguanine-DNA methyltransferase Ogt [Bacillus thuringiensis Bt407]|uniref:Methylated-DNA--protein-cysteine methyltransferase n=1 Tax=Bacillus thuringiensis T01-328 TaxID=1324966 RepID=A0AAN4HKY7_BACTU|nr:O6-methylguanine-DNA methyltransferase [Bacillus thuringiensis serovar chinensis CT-43]AFV17786.1 O6-methylguanine-DNA methyltransferase Ogt [Bacillus thuringiensis Bt407]AGG00719.1 Methylated-DNA--protein-cysteine methyltransferase [Bacillus thuringiensis serovar thuringiensis str. IS5056]EEM35516.1 methylated-DNA--protein-cysteine methyltransferase [Bacillus thuringiensis serovar thuringiensis str. T01001]EEM66417.1 methylated-DNA--protein-cysteine methyltransferase [Bacillus thuringiensis